MKMKKLMLVLCIGYTLAGCNGGNKENALFETPMKTTLDACVASVPNANNNELTRSVLADTITACFQTYRGKTLAQLNQLPCEYEMSMEYPDYVFDFIDSTISGKYVVKFNYSNSYSTTEKMSDDYCVMLQVFAMVEKEVAMQLVEGEKYYISGTFHDFANCSKETGFKLPSGDCIKSYPSVTKLDNILSISLGTIVLDNISFKKVSVETK